MYQFLLNCNHKINFFEKKFLRRKKNFLNREIITNLGANILPTTTTYDESNA